MGQVDKEIGSQGRQATDNICYFVACRYEISKVDSCNNNIGIETEVQIHTQKHI